MNTPDGRYYLRPYDSAPGMGTADNGRPPPWGYLRPWATNEERLTQQALAVALIPGDELRDVVRPPLSQIQLFPPRFGYPTRALGLTDVIDADRYYATNADAFSGGPAGYSGSSQYSQESY